MKIIVTGANSFIGFNLCKSLVEDKIDVYALINKNTDKVDLLHGNPHFHVITNLNDIKETDITALYHFAWQGIDKSSRNDKKIQEANIEMSKDILEYAISKKIPKFIYAGSQAEIGLRSEYGRAKAEFADFAEENIAKNNSNMKFFHLRIFSVYGKGDHEDTLINNLITSVRNNSKIKLSKAEQLWNYIYIDDAVDILKYFIDDDKMKEIPHRKYYELGSDETKPLKEYIGDIAKINDKFDKSNLEFGAIESNIEGDFGLNPDISWIKNYKFTKFDDAIKLL